MCFEQETCYLAHKIRTCVHSFYFLICCGRKNVKTRRYTYKKPKTCVAICTQFLFLNYYSEHFICLCLNELFSWQAQQSTENTLILIDYFINQKTYIIGVNKIEYINASNEN